VCVHAVEPKRHTCHRCIFPVLSVCVTLKSVHHRPQPHPPTPTHFLHSSPARTLHAQWTSTYHAPASNLTPLFSCTVGFYLMERGNTVPVSFVKNSCQEVGSRNGEAGGSQGACDAAPSAEYHLRRGASLSPANAGPLVSVGPQCIR
jgi:hypothetical protein